VGVISVRGATEHNLKDVSLDIPKEKLVAFTGISGSGKSSLVFDTLYAESFRRFLGAANLPSFVLGGAIEVKHARPKVRAITGLPLALGLSQRQGVASKLSTVGTVSGLGDLFRVYFAAFGDVYCRSCTIPLRPTTLANVQRSVLKAYAEKSVVVVAPLVEKRKGAFAAELEKFRQLGYSRLRVNGELCDLQDEKTISKIDAKKLNTLELLIDKIQVSETKLARLERAISDAVSYGRGVVKIECGHHVETFNTLSVCPQCGESSPKLDARHFSHSSLGQCEGCGGTGASGDSFFEDIYPCGSCGGARLGRHLPTVRVCGKSFSEVHSLSVKLLEPWIRDCVAPESAGEKAKSKVAAEMLRLCSTLCEMGVGHLNLNRSASSLSPGDLQRIRLSAMMSNPFSGALYVLDEPCQGLTAAEVHAFVSVLRKRVLSGSSVVVVEHHPVFLKECDVVFTLGPGAGVHGGRLVSVVDTPREDLNLTSGNAPHVNNNSALKPCISFEKITVRGIQEKSVSIVQGCVNLVRGPSGSGKLSFLDLVLNPILADLQNTAEQKTHRHCVVAQSNVTVKSVQVVRPGSLTRTSRRTVAAALDILPLLRTLFAGLPQSQLLGFTEMNFSWNSPHGRCEKCDGKGFIEIKQRYGPAVDVECETCLGARLCSRSLVPRFKGKNFFEVMQMSVEEAREFFSHIRNVESRLAAAFDFGLGYVTLAQGMDSLSGGELQRLLLTMELKRSSLEGAWFLLVHSGTGLHAPDIAVLGHLMRRMCAKGATFVMIENREEFFPFADNVVEFG
jgi:excinuclease ABC subunit A